MKKYIFAASLAAAVAVPALADGYDLVVTTTDDQTHKFSTANVEKVLFSDNLVDFPEYISGSYNTKGGSLGIYTISIANDEPDGAGDPAKLGDAQLDISFVSTLSEDVRNPQLPSGTYTIGNGTEAGTFDIQKSAVYLRTGEGSEGVEMMPIIAGNIDVLNVNGEYVLTGTVATLQGYAVEFIYSGPMGFVPSLSASSPFDSDLNVVFEGAQMRYYGDWWDMFADDVTFQLYTGDFTEEQGQLNGYWMNVALYMPKCVDPWSNDITIADGVYNVEWRERPENYTYLPFTYMPGAVIEALGMEFTTGTYISHKDTDGTSNLGLIESGTITVSENGTKFVFDMVMGNGKKFMATYEGEVLLGNFHDKDMPEGIEMLDSDVTLDWASGTVAVSFNDGHTILKDANTYIVMITESNMSAGDYISLYLLTDQDQLADGTYEIGKLENYGGIKGSVGYGGDILYSWYGDLDSTDAEGYQSVMAPIWGGTVTVSTTGTNKRKFELNLISKEGKKISGVYDGVYMDYADLPDAARKKMKSRRVNVKK